MLFFLYHTMGSHKLRDNKTCLNCGAFVHSRYCPKCGQENSESRQSFYHIFTHFVSDFFHYESSFWRTIRYLLFYPGRLSTEYMNGKRKSYTNPFSLYIFISFLAFFIPSVIPDFSQKSDADATGFSIDNTITKDQKIMIDDLSAMVDTIKATKKRGKLNYKINENYGTLQSVEEMEAVHQSLPEEKRISQSEYLFHKNILKTISNPDDKSSEKLVDFFIHNLPKALFMYMPIFAFWMWLFHNKKKRYYFDSGIFTLHFFSFWLLLLTILISTTTLLNQWGFGTLSGLLIFISILYVTFYFFRANRKFYAERRFISNIKALLLLLIHTIFIVLVSILYTLWSIFVVLY